MAQFSLKLSDETILIGTTFLEVDAKIPNSGIAIPLLVCVHGGSVNDEFFDLDEKRSVKKIGAALGVPVIAINRPGYKGTAPLARDDTSFIQRHARWLAGLALPAIWQEYSSKVNASSLVLYGESIGGAVSVVAAGILSDKPAGFPFAGLAISAMGGHPNTVPLKDLFDGDHPPDFVLDMPLELRQELSFGKTPELFAPDAKHNSRGMSPVTVEEIHDINLVWPTYYKKYAAKIKVQVFHALGEFDGLWHLDRDKLAEFAASFSSAFSVEQRLIKDAPHCIEYGYLCTGFYLRLFGFAMEYAESHRIASART